MATNVGRKNVVSARQTAIKLQAVTDAERERLRVSTYEYLLP